MNDHLRSIPIRTDSTVLFGVTIGVVALSAQNDEICSQRPNRHKYKAKPEDALIDRWYAASGFGSCGKPTGKSAFVLRAVDLAIGHIVKDQRLGVRAVDQPANNAIANRCNRRFDLSRR